MTALIDIAIAELPINGAHVLVFPKQSDFRGSFARCMSVDIIRKFQLKDDIKQVSISYNAKKNTLRGMHFQTFPFEEAKYVMCITGSIYDVIIDLRKGSPTYLKWHAEVLSEENHKVLYVPEGCAHGFLTLQNESNVLYQINNYFNGEASRGYRWNDPAFEIYWPIDGHITISEKDANYSNYVK